MFVLHWEYMAGSIVVQAVLHDTEAEFELRHVDMASDEHKEPTYLGINPTGRVPALTLPDGRTIGETGAILTYLCDSFPEACLSPRQGGTDRPEFLFWLNVMTTTGYPTVVRWNHPERYAKSPDAIAEVAQQSSADLESFFDLVEEAISGQSSVLRSGFSALDYYLCMLTEWSADRATLFSARPKIASVYASTSERPAYIATMSKHSIPKEAA